MALERILKERPLLKRFRTQERAEEKWEHVVQVTYDTRDLSGDVKTRDGAIHPFDASEADFTKAQRVHTIDSRVIVADFTDALAWVEEDVIFAEEGI